MAFFNEQYKLFAVYTGHTGCAVLRKCAVWSRGEPVFLNLYNFYEFGVVFKISPFHSYKTEETDEMTECFLITAKEKIE